MHCNVSSAGKVAIRYDGGAIWPCHLQKCHPHLPSSVPHRIAHKNTQMSGHAAQRQVDRNWLPLIAHAGEAASSVRKKADCTCCVESGQKQLLRAIEVNRCVGHRGDHVRAVRAGRVLGQRDVQLVSCFAAVKAQRIR